MSRHPEGAFKASPQPSPTQLTQPSAPAKHLLLGTHPAPALMTVAFPSVASAAASAPVYRSPANSAGGGTACSRKALPSAPSKTTYVAPSACRRRRTRARYQLSAASLVTFRRAQSRPFHVVSSGTCGTGRKFLSDPLNIPPAPGRKAGGCLLCPHPALPQFAPSCCNA